MRAAGQGRRAVAATGRAGSSRRGRWSARSSSVKRGRRRAGRRRATPRCAAAQVRSALSLPCCSARATVWVPGSSVSTSSEAGSTSSAIRQSGGPSSRGCISEISGSPLQPEPEERVERLLAVAQRQRVGHLDRRRREQPVERAAALDPEVGVGARDPAPAERPALGPRLLDAQRHEAARDPALRAQDVALAAQRDAQLDAVDAQRRDQHAALGQRAREPARAATSSRR